MIDSDMIHLGIYVVSTMPIYRSDYDVEYSLVHCYDYLLSV